MAFAGNGGNGAQGGDGGDGGSGGSGWGVPAAYASDDEDDEDDDDDDEDEDDDDDDDDDDDAPRRAIKDGNFIVESVLATNLPMGPGIPTKAELFGGLNARKGNEVSKDDLSNDLEVLTTVRKQGQCTVRVLATMKNIIEGYYTSKGITFGTISHFDGMETGDVVAHVIEGEITRVKAVFLDDQMQPITRGRTHPRVIQREHNFKVGQLYNVEDAKTALRDIFLLQLFDNVQVVPRPDDRDQSKVQVDIVLRERPVKTAESELEWSIAPGEGGRPDFVSVRPGGSVLFEHRNLDGWGRQLYGSVSTANFLA